MRKLLHRVLPAAMLAVGTLIAAASAAEVTATAATAEPLQALIDRAAPGAVLELPGGRYAGPVVIRKPLTLVGAAGATIVGSGQGNAVTVASPDVTIRNLAITGSGMSLEQMNSGIFLADDAERAIVEGNQLTDNLIGVYVHGAKEARVENNMITGRKDLRLNEAGNGVYVWNAPGAQVIGNDIRYGRDGIYVIASRNNVFHGNRLRDLRYAVHYMYTHDSEVSGNISIANHAGFAIMYSDRLKIANNLSVGDRDKGLFLNFANSSDIGWNIVEGKPEKCVFLYNANKNRFHDNKFEDCEIGIHFTAGSERNRISGNAFINNRTQVKYVGTRFLDWSDEGRGNYWSDNPAFDLDGDGLADTAYRPNDMIDEVLWVNPNAKILLNSPAVQLLRWAQASFPALYPGGVVDTAPLIAPPDIKAPEWKETAR